MPYVGRAAPAKPRQIGLVRGQNWPPAAPNEATRIERALLLLPGDEKEVGQAARIDELRADPRRDREEDHPRETVAEKTNRAHQRRGRADGEENRAVQHATQFSVLDRPLSGC